MNSRITTFHGLGGVSARLLGEVSVDSGMIMLSDPCYHLFPKENGFDTDKWGSNWDEFVDKIYPEDNSSAPSEVVGTSVICHADDGGHRVYELMDGDKHLGYFIDTGYEDLEECDLEDGDEDYYDEDESDTFE